MCCASAAAGPSPAAPHIAAIGTPSKRAGGQGKAERKVMKRVSESGTSLWEGGMLAFKLLTAQLEGIGGIQKRPGRNYSDRGSGI